MSQTWRAWRPQTGPRALWLTYDKTRVYTSSGTVVFLEENNVHIMTSPPYTPRLDPCELFPFYLVKRQLKGKQLHSSKEERAFVEGAILPLSQSGWPGAMENRFQRMAMCIRTDGGFF